METGYGAWAVEHVLQALGIPVEEGKLEQDRGEEGLEPCRWPGVQDELEGPRGLRAEPSHTVGGRGGALRAWSPMAVAGMERKGGEEDLRDDL